MYVFSAEGGDALGIKLECTYKFTKDSELANPVGSPWWQRIGQFGEIAVRHRAFRFGSWKGYPSLLRNEGASKYVVPSMFERLCNSFLLISAMVRIYFLSLGLIACICPLAKRVTMLDGLNIYLFLFLGFNTLYKYCLFSHCFLSSFSSPQT